jgi:hypothetical protein
VRTRPDKAAVTRTRIALLCCAAGLTVAGAIIAVDAIARRVETCAPYDPYFLELCAAPRWAFNGTLVACWLLAMYLLARREAISAFACVFMALMLWFGIGAGLILSDLVNDTRLFDGFGFADQVVGILQFVVFVVPILSVVTAVLGLGMQFFIRAWRERQVQPRPVAPAVGRPGPSGRLFPSPQASSRQP